jgi:hypothetical protein
MNKSAGFHWKSETLLIAVIPALIYFIVYIRELSFCYYFDIPKGLVEINKSTILGFALAILVLIAIPLCATGLYAFFDKTLKGRPKGLYAYSGLILVLTVAMIISSSFSVSTIILLILSIGISVAGFVKAFNTFLFSNQRDAVGGIFLLIIFSAVFAAILGVNSAREQKMFVIPSSHPDCVVLRISDDRLICAEFDRDKKTIYPIFRILKIGEDKDLLLKLEAVGPLKPNER